ncbi:hypothetical protein SASPL_111184 [Salvia splendens]|uniref:Uncharacterized protein n=1 Tax=Salvia splendens TaxID=180675 RepID=A0A8X8Y5Y6_SALSN|nr:hypothetical protein SASPL_111184 [Salvia splendens]
MLTSCRRRLRLAKGKAVADGETSGKWKFVGGVPVQTKRPQLRIKRTTRFFWRILKSMNERQKNAVRQLGFGGLLDFDVTSVPGTLAYWLLEHFDHVRCSLLLPNDIELVVETKDVELVFGFPNGRIKIDRCDLNTGFKYLETIPLEEEIDVHAMQTKVLETKVLQETGGGGAMFKKIFLLLMETALIETSPCGYVRPRIVDILGNLQKIRKHDWCRYLLDNLLRTRELWKNNRSKVFSGPLVFLVAFYVDRVVHRRRCVQRAIPRVKGWTAELLKEREDEELKEVDFGRGRVVSKYDENELGSVEMSTGVEHPEAAEDVVENRDGSEEWVYIRGVWGAVKHIGDGLKLLAKELNQAPPDVRKMDSFRITCDTLRRAFRLDDNVVDPAESMTQTQSAQSTSVEDWSALTFLLDTAEKMDILENKDEYPSFSLCFDASQDGDACHRDSGRREGTDNPANAEDFFLNGLREPSDELFSGDEGVSHEGEREPAANLGGDCGDFMSGSDNGREPLTAVKAGTVVNEENALDVVRAIARDVDEEHDEVDIAICSAVEAVYVLGDAAFETQTDTRGVDMGKFPVRGDAESSDHVVYDDDMVELSKRKFSTLKPHEAVDVGVVDAWAWYLNHMEEEKTTQITKRFFATTSPTTFNVVERRTTWLESEAVHSFCEEMDGQFNMDENFDFTKYDMTGIADVLDIVVPENGIPDASKYATDLGLLRNFLGYYLESKGLNAMCEVIMKEQNNVTKQNNLGVDNVTKQNNLGDIC